MKKYSFPDIYYPYHFSGLKKLHKIPPSLPPSANSGQVCQREAKYLPLCKREAVKKLFSQAEDGQGYWKSFTAIPFLVNY